MKHIKKFENIDFDNDWDEEEDDPTVNKHFEGHEKFYQFLIDNNCLDEYIKNSNLFISEYNYFSNIKEFLNSVKCINFFDN